MSSQT